MSMIGPTDGRIEFDSPKVVFSRGMTLRSFQQSPFFSRFTLVQDLDPCFSYDFGPMLADKRTFKGTAWFYSEVILKVSLEIVQPARPYSDQFFHRDYLREILGYTKVDEASGGVDYGFAWGHVVVAETKGDESSIWVHYSA